MLNLTDTIPEIGFVYDVDAYFCTISFKDYLPHLATLLSELSLTLIEEDYYTEYIYAKDILVRHKITGVTTLNNIPTGLKVLILAHIHKLKNMPFSCYEFLVGGNLIPKLLEIASDTSLVTLVAIDLTFTSIRRNPTQHKILIKGEERLILC